jgi:bile acid-coenzyme A ligase
MANISLSRILAYWREQQADAAAVVHGDQRTSWASSTGAATAWPVPIRHWASKRTTSSPSRCPTASSSSSRCSQPGSSVPRRSRSRPSCRGWSASRSSKSASPARRRRAGRQPRRRRHRTRKLPADADLSDEPLPERTATYFKAMTSGGSTGRPKLIVSHIQAQWDPEGDFMNFSRAGSVLIPGPLYHNGPFMWAMIALFKGNRVTVTTRFDAAGTLALIEAERVDTVYMVPTMMQRIWHLPADVKQHYDLSSLRCLWHLAAPCPPWLKEAFIDWLGADVIWELYGGTEGQGSTIISGSEWLLHRGSVGKPLERCEMKIVDEDGNTLPPGQVGEVFMRPTSGVGTTYHYLGAEPRAIEGGWESLGDMGYMDADGYLYLSDRRTDMILSGGANIYPAEVEAAIDAYPGVRSSAVSVCRMTILAMPCTPSSMRLEETSTRTRCWHIWRSAWCATRFPAPSSSSMSRCATMPARCAGRHCATRACAMI